MPVAIAPLKIRTINDASASENRIHSDEVAARYGFHGALVSGINVFGYLTQPLVAQFGEHYLQHSMMDVRFFKPAYEDEVLDISTEEDSQRTDQEALISSARNRQGTLLATLHAWRPPHLPAASDIASLTPGITEEAQRQPIHWDLIEIGKAAPAYCWQPGASENAERLRVQSETSPLYRGEQALIHPCLVLDACNKALMRMFVLPAWVHTGSRLTLRRPLRIGQSIEVRCVPVDKWERKGHQFIRLYITLWEQDALALEVEHTAIFRLAEHR